MKRLFVVFISVVLMFSGCERIKNSLGLRSPASPIVEEAADLENSETEVDELEPNSPIYPLIRIFIGSCGAFIGYKSLRLQTRFLWISCSY